MSDGRLTDDEYLCPACHAGAHHDHGDGFFTLEPFGLLACCCQICAPYPST